MIYIKGFVYDNEAFFVLTKAKELGLKIYNLEEDDAFQDAVLSIHHCYMHTFSNSSAVKIIENHKGIATVSIAQNIQKN